MDGTKFLTLAETALVLRVTKRSVQRFVADGRLPVVRVGGIVRVPAAVFDAMTAAALDALTSAEPAEAS